MTHEAECFSIDRGAFDRQSQRDDLSTFLLSIFLLRRHLERQVILNSAFRISRRQSGIGWGGMGIGVAEEAPNIRLLG
jgi:hypothetical protein